MNQEKTDEAINMVPENKGFLSRIPSYWLYLVIALLVIGFVFMLLRGDRNVSNTLSQVVASINGLTGQVSSLAERVTTMEENNGILLDDLEKRNKLALDEETRVALIKAKLPYGKKFKIFETDGMPYIQTTRTVDGEERYDVFMIVADINVIGKSILTLDEIKKKISAAFKGKDEETGELILSLVGKSLSQLDGHYVFRGGSWNKDQLDTFLASLVCEAFQFRDDKLAWETENGKTYLKATDSNCIKPVSGVKVNLNVDMTEFNKSFQEYVRGQVENAMDEKIKSLD